MYNSSLCKYTSYCCFVSFLNINNFRYPSDFFLHLYLFAQFWTQVIFFQPWVTKSLSSFMSENVYCLYSWITTWLNIKMFTFFLPQTIVHIDYRFSSNEYWVLVWRETWASVLFCLLFVLGYGSVCVCVCICVCVYLSSEPEKFSLCLDIQLILPGNICLSGLFILRSDVWVLDVGAVVLDWYWLCFSLRNIV